MRSASYWTRACCIVIRTGSTCASMNCHMNCCWLTQSIWAGDPHHALDGVSWIVICAMGSCFPVFLGLELYNLDYKEIYTMSCSNHADLLQLECHWRRKHLVKCFYRELQHWTSSSCLWPDRHLVNHLQDGFTSYSTIWCWQLPDRTLMFAFSFMIINTNRLSTSFSSWLPSFSSNPWPRSSLSLASLALLTGASRRSQTRGDYHCRSIASEVSENLCQTSRIALRSSCECRLDSSLPVLRWDRLWGSSIDTPAR